MSRKLIERSVIDIMNRLRGDGFQAYLVGGCVRDILLGKKPKDFDIVTDARPRQIKRLFRRCFLIGRRFRLAHVYISRDRFVEVATFRAAVDPDRAEEAGFAANNVYGTIEEDAQRRDFSVNALYFNGADASILDYSGGLKDMKKKVLRSIGDPAQRYREDPVRMIRAARFCAQLGFDLSRPDHRAAVACASLIREANAHRMLEELYKILRCAAASGTIQNLHDFKILPYWLPELSHEKYLHTLLPRLAALDSRRSRGEEVPNAVLLAVLLYDLLDEALGERRGFQDSFSMLHQRYSELATRLRIPRREWDSVCDLAARQPSLARIPDPRKGKGFEKRFLHNAHFPNALLFFELQVEATGRYREELNYWKERASRVPHDGGGHQRENVIHGQGGGRRP
ncbi:MAG: hypothetical protein A2176_06895 [Spirochaetes bacterium RBG_13_51_14]|nr:MAG: hypothetical protein A2176_06895 [Spirochaetes bacterium RBG_13_51_14]